MPPGPGGDEWLVARFDIDNMYTNNGHRKILAPGQQYTHYYFILNGDVRPDSVIELDWLIVWRGDDSKAPSRPGGLRAERSGGKVTLSWNASTDNVMVGWYDVLRRKGGDWQRVSVATSNWAVLPTSGLAEDEYAVRAVDVAGNVSGPSEPVRVQRQHPGDR